MDHFAPAARHDASILRNDFDVMGNSPLSGLAFTLFCLVTVVMILRPGDLVSGLAGLPIYEVLILSTFALAHRGILDHFKPNALKRQPVVLCLVGTFIAIPVSHMTHMYFGGTVHGTIEFTKSAMLFALLIVVVDRWSRFEKLITTVALMATVIVLMSVADYYQFMDFEFIKHAVENYGVSATGEDICIVRMAGTGIFSDPNDISLLIVASGIICASFLFDRQRRLSRLGWIIPLLILGIGLICTKSRGGILSTGAAIGIILMFRYGKWAAITIGSLGVVALPVVLGRQANIDISDGTGHDRIMLWRDGLSALRSKDILFGTGEGSYSDIAGLVAHNSFVHAYVELGFIGGTFFFGMFLFCVVGLFRLNTPEWRIDHERQARFLPYMAAIGAGWTVGLLTLSRCYTASTLLILALGAAYLNLAGWKLRPRQLVTKSDRKHIVQMVAASIALFVALNLFVRFVA